MDPGFFLSLFDPQTVQSWFEWGGYFILFGLLFACGIGLPLPEDLPLLIAGYFTAQPEGTPGKMHLLPVAIVAWCGIIGGDCVLYWLSRKYGLNITRVRMIGQHVTKERIIWAEGKFEQYGIWVVAICRMFAGVRGAMVIAAGAIKFNFAKFVIADGLAALVSGGLFVYLGHLAGKKLGSVAEMRERIKEYEHFVGIGIALLVIVLVLYFWWRHSKHTTISEVAFDKVKGAAEKIGHARTRDDASVKSDQPVI